MVMNKPISDEDLPACACGIVNELSKDWMTPEERAFWSDVVRRVHVRGVTSHSHLGSVEYAVVREHTTPDGERVLDEIRPISLHIGGMVMMTKVETALREWFAANRAVRSAIRESQADVDRCDAAEQALYEALMAEVKSPEQIAAVKIEKT